MFGGSNSCVFIPGPKGKNHDKHIYRRAADAGTRSRLIIKDSTTAPASMQLHDYQDETALSGRRVDFSSFAGKPVLFVNVASE